VTAAAAPLAFARVDVQRLDSAGHYVKSGNYKEAYAHFKTMGNQGCPFSNCLLGAMLQKGQGVEKSIPLAIKRYKLSASKGFRDAETRLARLYDNGEEGLQRDAKAAALWYKRAAKHGVAEAQYKLGNMYLKGDGVKERSFKAKIWLRKAADQGMGEASQLLSSIPGESDVSRQAQDVMARAGSNYQVGWTNIEKSWEGYVDIVKALDSATVASH
jgi:TPR repeat protein